MFRAGVLVGPCAMTMVVGCGFCAGLLGLYIGTELTMAYLRSKNVERVATKSGTLVATNTGDEGKKKEPVEMHKPWAELEHVRSNRRRGWSSKGDRKKHKFNLYEQDKLHIGEVEVYNERGEHRGTTTVQGGEHNQSNCVDGRTIDV